MPSPERRVEKKETGDQKVKRELFESLDRQLVLASTKPPKTKAAYESGLIEAVNKALNGKHLEGERRRNLFAWLMGQGRQHEKWLPPGKNFGPKTLHMMRTDAAKHEKEFGPDIPEDAPMPKAT